jgi:AsmA protein
MSKSARNHLIGFAILVALLAAPFLIPLNMYKAPMETAASRALSRPVHIKGPVHFSFYPRIGLALSDVEIGNVPGARDPQMMTAERVLVGAEIGPLFAGRLQVTDLTLEHPKIHLELVKAGEPNWSFGRDANGNPSDPASLGRIGFTHVGIKDGEVTYFDAASGKNAVLTDVGLSLDMRDSARPSLNVPLNLGGEVTYNGTTLKIDGHLDNFGQVLDGHSTVARISIGSMIINAEFTGQVGAEGGISGALKLGARSVRSFAAWLGHPLPPGNGLGLIALEGTFTARNGVYSLSHTNVRFDSMNVNGDIALDTNPEVMLLKGHVAIDRVNVLPYLAPGANDDTVAAAKAKSANPDAPLALSGLKAVDADMTMVVGGLVLPGVKLDQALVKATLHKGVLEAEMSHVTAYGGEGKGSLTVDASGPVPSFHDTLEINGMKVQPFLAELAGVHKITGTGAVRLNISSRGDTAQAMVRALHGNGDLHVTNGEIADVNLGAVAHLVETALRGEIPADVAGPSAETPFARLGASFMIENGVVRSNDIQLTGPVQMSGRGTADLAARTLEVHFTPKAGRDIGVPFYVKGSWQKPSYGPDMRDLAKSIAERLEASGASPLDLLKKPGLSLKSILGSEKRATQ